MSISSNHSNKLYAFLLKLRPLQRGTLKPFSGELAHAAWLEWMRWISPDVATKLHSGNKRRLFTCSSLQFPLSLHKLRKAEQENGPLVLEPEKTYTLRITLLLGELFPLICDSLMGLNPEEFGARQPPFMQLGRQIFLLEEIIVETSDLSNWTGITSYAELVERARMLESDDLETLAMEFASLTTFNRINVNNKKYGNYSVYLPLPQYIFPSLAKRWQELAPEELVNVVQSEYVEQYLQDDGMVISDYDLKAHQVSFSTHIQRGFVGMCKYNLRSPDEIMEGSPLTIRQQINMLAQFAFYCGVGYKTAMGMGQVRLL